MTKSTIQELLNSGSYILEDPQTGLLNIGELTEQGSSQGVFMDYGERAPIYISEPSYQLTRAELTSELKKLLLNDKRGEELVWSKSLEADYISAFSDSKKLLKDGALDKIVLYREAVASVKNGRDTFLKSLSSVLSLNPSGFLYSLIIPEEGRYLVGLAPEYLFKKNTDGGLETTAVAGTGEHDESLLSDTKLLKEHKAVEKDISNSLKDCVDWGAVNERKHVSLKHLVSVGLIKRYSGEKVSKLLHPTSAVGVMPKTVNLDYTPGPEPRGFYGGYAELLLGSMEFSLVLIRGLEIKRNKVKLQFGGGVIEESILDHELRELDLKFNNLRNLWKL